MKIELVEIYKEKTENKNFIGTAHIYLIDYDIDLRGIGVFKKHNGYYCKLSDRFATDADTQKRVRYPVFRFTNPEKHKELMHAILAAIKEYMKEKK